MSNTATLQPETLTIVGYSQDEVCAHCGKSLIHGIRLADGRVVGAQCLNKVLTLPQVYGGKSYRVGHENIIRYAKIAERYTESEGIKRFGVGIYQRTFKADLSVKWKD
jgi:hypothetical protein